MDSVHIDKLAQQYVEQLFEKNKNENLLYHNLEHTRNVVARCNEIAADYDLNERQLLILDIAAWFHDTGHLFDKCMKGHEEKGVDIMRKFMHENNADEEMINEIASCIMATKMPRNPVTLPEEIICDADTYHFGTKEFKETNKNMHEEFNQREHFVDKDEWNQETYDMLVHHKYYTKYAKEMLNDKKQDNIDKLKKKLKRSDDKASKDLKIDDAKSLTVKGIQTMLRLTSENHLKLSDMADHKANILISVNSIIISVILGVLVRKLEEDPYLTIPTIIFLIISVTTIVIAILATMPKVSGGNFNDADVANKKTNLLFFGNFYKAPFEKYDKAMRSMMNESDYLYGSLIKDIYSLGVVLGRKYRLIRIAYYIFMIGIIVSVIAFGIAVFIYNTTHVSAGNSGASAFPL